ncbi:precorrin-2 C(20)-methyltransferase [Eubacteriales bacterium KG127]
MNNGRFFAVGVGPGDPELMTVKAIKTIERADIIVIPTSGGKTNTAMKIAQEYVKDKEVVSCHMPMSKKWATEDWSKIEVFHNDSADVIANLLDEGKDVAFLTLGDPTVYSTVMYVHRILDKRGYPTEIVPGITSFCAAAARLNVSLCEKDEMLHVIPATFTNLDEIEGYKGTKVLMKSGKTIMDVKERLAKDGAMMVEKATMEGEKIYKNMGELEEPSSYFSLVVLHSKERQENK